MRCTPRWLLLWLVGFHFFCVSAPCQIFLDATVPESEEQSGPRTGSAGINSSVKRPTLPLEVTIRDLYPVSASYGDQISVTLLLRNVSKESLDIPCSRNFTDVSTDGNKDQRGLGAFVRLMEGKIPVQIVVAVFGGSASVPGSMCTMPPNGTILVRGQGRIESQSALEDPSLAGTTLNAKASIQESYYDDHHVEINFSQDCVSVNSVSLYWLGRKPKP